MLQPVTNEILIRLLKFRPNVQQPYLEHLIIIFIGVLQELLITNISMNRYIFRKRRLISLKIHNFYNYFIFCFTEIFKSKVEISFHMYLKKNGILAFGLYNSKVSCKINK